jgi:hypothetical protein
MSNTYTWAIDALDCVPSVDEKSNIVSCVHWRVNASDGKNNATIYGTQNLAFDNKSIFVVYDEIAKETAITWVQEAIGKDAVQKLYKSLDSNIYSLANPSIITLPLPWENK